MSNFDTLFESELSRFTSHGFLVGDLVKIKKDAINDEYVKNRAQSFRDFIKACSDPSFDLNLRIGAIKSIYPTTTQNYGNGTQSPDSIFLDIYVEYAPGLYRNPVTLPIRCIEVIDTGNDRGPIPNSLRRPNNIHGPEETEANSDIKADVNLKNQNVQLPGANKWDDTQPGGGNFKPKR